MDATLDKLLEWSAAGESSAFVVSAALVAFLFVVFNALRVLLYLPQIATCLADELGCPTINLWTWCSWLAANASTGAYLWMFHDDLWGLVLNLGNAAMCGVTIGVTWYKRHRCARCSGARGELSRQ